MKNFQKVHNTTFSTPKNYKTQVRILAKKGRLDPQASIILGFFLVPYDIFFLPYREAIKGKVPGENGDDTVMILIQFLQKKKNYLRFLGHFY